MKVLLVTSQVLYVPSNYLDLFETVLSKARPLIAGIVILKNFNWRLVRDAFGLRVIGCKRVSATLVRNMVGLSQQKRERLFELHSIPVLRARSMNEAWIAKWVRANGIDLIVNLRTRSIYKKEILETPRLACLNLHHGLLPEHRGTMCDLYALHEERPAGFTIHVMNEKIDAGRILVREPVSRVGEKDYIRYLARAAQVEGERLSELLLEVKERGSLPEGVPNETIGQVVFTRNPTRKKIREMRLGGMVL